MNTGRRIGIGALLVMATIVAILGMTAVWVQRGDVTLDLRPLIEQASERGGLLGGAAQSLPEDAGQLQVLKPDQLETAQNVVKILRPPAIVLVLLAIALYVIAVLLSPDRRRTTVYVGFAILFAALAVLAIRRLGGTAVVDALAQTPDSEPAVCWIVLGALLLGLIWWHPVPWTGRVIPLLVLAVAAFAWLEVVRRRVAEGLAVNPS